MHQQDSESLAAGMRGRLMLGLPFLAVFAVILQINAGVQVHTYFEARESIAYHEKEMAESSGTHTPGRRIESLKADRDEALGTIVLSLGMSGFFGGLMYFGWRTLARSRR